MKKIIVFLAVCAMALCATSCIKQAPGIALAPESVTLKVGESKQLHPSIFGEGIEIDDIKVINSVEGVCFMNDRYQVTGLKPGTSRVGIGVPKDKDDVSKGMKYEAYTVVTVTE